VFMAGFPLQHMARVTVKGSIYLLIITKSAIFRSIYILVRVSIVDHIDQKSPLP
jgi:hypothetical protein